MDWRITARPNLGRNVWMGVLMIDKSQYVIRLMENLKNRQIFRNRACITVLLKRRGKTLEAKRKIIMMANTPLFYAFGYEYEPKKETEYGFGY